MLLRISIRLIVEIICIENIWILTKINCIRVCIKNHITIIYSYYVPKYVKPLPHGDRLVIHHLLMGLFSLPVTGLRKPPFRKPVTNSIDDARLHLNYTPAAQVLTQNLTITASELFELIDKFLFLSQNELKFISKAFNL